MIMFWFRVVACFVSALQCVFCFSEGQTDIRILFCEKNDPQYRAIVDQFLCNKAFE